MNLEKLKTLNKDTSINIIDSIDVNLFHNCPRITKNDGQKIKDIDFDVYNVKCNNTSTDYDILPEKYNKDTGMSSRLCIIFDTIYPKYLNEDISYRFLDCGCADAKVVEYVNKKYPNIEAVGCEISRPWVKAAKNKGINVFYGDINNPDTFGGRKFDIILSSKVLGLTRNFRQSLLNLCELLNENGYIFLLFGFIKRSNTNHYCLIEHPDIVLNWIENYEEFKDIKIKEVIYNITELASDEVLIILNKG